MILHPPNAFAFMENGDPEVLKKCFMLRQILVLEKGGIMNQRELNLVRKLRDKLKDKFETIYIHRKPSSSSNLREAIKRQLGNVPILQPDLDMIFKEKSGKLNAVRVESFTSSEFGKNMSFYRGIGQALALHRYGFDNVALWHFIPDDIPLDAIKKCGAETWSFISNEMQMPLDFSYIKISNIYKDYAFSVMQYTGGQRGVKPLPIDNPRFRIVWRNPNPIKDLITQRAVRSSLELWLNGELDG